MYYVMLTSLDRFDDVIIQSTRENAKREFSSDTTHIIIHFINNINFHTYDLSISNNYRPENKEIPFGNAILSHKNTYRKSSYPYVTTCLFFQVYRSHVHVFYYFHIHIIDYHIHIHRFSHSSFIFSIYRSLFLFIIDIS